MNKELSKQDYECLCANAYNNKDVKTNLENKALNVFRKEEIK